MKDFILDLWNGDLIERLLVLAIVLAVLLIPISIYAAIEEDREWQEFSAAHDCKVISKEKGHLSTGVGYGMAANGQFGAIVTTSSTPDKTAYSCNDGVTYWR